MNFVVQSGIRLEPHSPGRRRALRAALAAGAPALWPTLGTAQFASQPPLVTRSLAARALAGLAPRIDAEMPDVQSVVVLHRGQTALEYHRAGIAPDTLQDTQSVTKSVLSLLFGIAVAEGRIRSSDSLVAEKLPEMLRLGADPRLQGLRFEHLLTMTAGWPGEQTARRDRDDDLMQIVRRPLISPPGTRFIYDNGAANLLALALTRAVAQPLAAYARDRLMAPLGITRFDWMKGGEGRELGAMGLRMTVRDMARIGELVRLDGMWQGRPLVPADYLRRATSRRNAGGPPVETGYGYLWWVGGTQRGTSPGRAPAMASGYGGQWIWVAPALSMVVAATSLRTAQSMTRGQAATLIRAQIAPALRRL